MSERDSAARSHGKWIGIHQKRGRRTPTRHWGSRPSVAKCRPKITRRIGVLRDKHTPFDPNHAYKHRATQGPQEGHACRGYNRRCRTSPQETATQVDRSREHSQRSVRRQSETTRFALPGTIVFPAISLPEAQPPSPGMQTKAAPKRLVRDDDLPRPGVSMQRS